MTPLEKQEEIKKNILKCYSNTDLMKSAEQVENDKNNVDGKEDADSDMNKDKTE